jgi:sterol 3beta-glucosyltransferase
MYFLRPEDLKLHEDALADDVDDSQEPEYVGHHGEIGKVPPLNVVIMIVGSRGDVQPFIAFGKGLQAAGHRVRLATHVTFRQFVTENGLDFYPLKGNPEHLMNFMVNHPDMITLDPMEIKKQKEMMESIYYSTYAAATGLGFHPDVLISNPPVHVHVHLAQKLQVPLNIMFTMPWSATKDYMHPLAPMQNMLENKQSYAVVDKMIWVGLGGIMNEFRKSIGLQALSQGASLVSKLRVPQTYCMSPHLAPKPTDWGPHIDVVGFWFLDLVTNYKPDKDLLDFLDAGEAPIYIGFGSIVVDNPRKLSENVIEALKISKRRALVSPGWAKLGEGMALPPTIKLIGAVPHDWLFTKCSGVIHHGGAGTTAAGLKAGCPTLVVPFFGDQPFWGSCVAKMGVGPPPVPYKKLTVENLAEAIAFLAKGEVRQRAKELGQKLSSENGVQKAVEVFHSRLPIKDNVWIDEIHENMKKDPGFGWSHQSLPNNRTGYSEKTGTLELTFKGFDSHPGWEWIDAEWQPLVEPGKTDRDGWKYGSLFTAGAGEWNPSATSTDSVRTRKLLRKKKFVGTPAVKYGKKLLFIDVIEGKDLASKDVMGASDPFVVLKVGNHKQHTEVIDNNANPVWKETLWFEVDDSDMIELECWDKDPVGKDLIGRAHIAVKSVAAEKDEWIPISEKHKESGKIHVKYHVIEPK